MPAARYTGEELEHWADVPEREMLIYSNAVGPDWLIMIWQKLNPRLSVMFAVMLITSPKIIFVIDLFKVVFTVGEVVSLTVIIVSLVLQLFDVSFTLIV